MKIVRNLRHQTYTLRCLIYKYIMCIYRIYNYNLCDILKVAKTLICVNAVMDDKLMKSDWETEISVQAIMCDCFFTLTVTDVHKIFYESFHKIITLTRSRILKWYPITRHFTLLIIISAGCAGRAKSLGLTKPKSYSLAIPVRRY